MAVTTIYSKILNSLLLLNFIPSLTVQFLGLFASLFTLLNNPFGLIIGSIFAIGSFIFNMILLPSFLLKSNFDYNKKRKKKLFVMNFFLMIISSLLGVGLNYLIWGIFTGDFFKPDFETVIILQLSISVSFMIILIGSALIQYRLSKSKY